jgi:hypothetical protein
MNRRRIAVHNIVSLTEPPAIEKLKKFDVLRLRLRVFESLSCAIRSAISGITGMSELLLIIAVRPLGAAIVRGPDLEVGAFRVDLPALAVFSDLVTSTSFASSRVGNTHRFGSSVRTLVLLPSGVVVEIF